MRSKLKKLYVFNPNNLIDCRQCKHQKYPEISAINYDYYHCVLCKGRLCSICLIRGYYKSIIVPKSFCLSCYDKWDFLSLTEEEYE